MIEIRPRNSSNEAFEKAMRKFKKVCDKSGIVKEVKDRRYYKKPSEKRREKLRESLHRRKK